MVLASPVVASKPLPNPPLLAEPGRHENQPEIAFRNRDLRLDVGREEKQVHDPCDAGAGDLAKVGDLSETLDIPTLERALEMVGRN